MKHASFGSQILNSIITSSLLHFITSLDGLLFGVLRIFYHLVNFSFRCFLSLALFLFLCLVIWWFVWWIIYNNTNVPHQWNRCILGHLHLVFGTYALSFILPLLSSFPPLFFPPLSPSFFFLYCCLLHLLYLCNKILIIACSSKRVGQLTSDGQSWRTILLVMIVSCSSGLPDKAEEDKDRKKKGRKEEKKNQAEAPPLV